MRQRILQPVDRAKAIVLTMSGFAAAFAVASCCVLPLVLGALGIGTAWLFPFAILAAPHRIGLLTIAAIALGGGAVLLWHPRSIGCDSAASYAHPFVRCLTAIGLLLGTLLLAAGYVY